MYMSCVVGRVVVVVVRGHVSSQTFDSAIVLSPHCAAVGVHTCSMVKFYYMLIK